MQGKWWGILAVAIGLGLGGMFCTRSVSRPRTLEEFERAIAGKSEREIAAFVFETYGCQTCHRVEEGKQWGFTSYGLQRKREFEGCIPLLAAMNVIAQIPEGERTAEQRAKAARFEEFGCTFCHQIRPGEMGLTEIGRRLASLHLPCSGVKRALTSQ